MAAWNRSIGAVILKMADKSPLVDYESDHEDDNPRNMEEMLLLRIEIDAPEPARTVRKHQSYGATAETLKQKRAPNASATEKEPAEPDPGAQSDPMDPAAKVPTWYRDILGKPESWAEARWQQYFEGPVNTGAGVKGASAQGG